MTFVKWYWQACSAMTSLLPEDGRLGPKQVASILKYKCTYFNNIKTF
jgi:hypothetical protein